MSKKYSIKAGLRAGIYMTLVLIVTGLINRNNDTVKEITINILSALIVGAVTGLINGWLFTFNPKPDFVKNLINTDEQLLFDTPASYCDGKKLIPGTLCITNKRLVYESNSGSMKKYNFSVDLNEIEYAERYRNSGCFKNGLAIHTSQKTIEKFVADMASEWMKMIIKVTSGLAQAAY